MLMRLFADFSRKVLPGFGHPKSLRYLCAAKTEKNVT